MTTIQREVVNQIIQGDCLDVLPSLPENCVDCLVTDPPYGYSFMGKDWDRAVPSVEVWRECLRVLKHGSFMFVMSSPRQDVLSQMIVRIGEAGFRTDFTSIYWTYASGFPKAMNISKAVDKKLGHDTNNIPITYRKFEDITANNFGRKDGKTESTKQLYDHLPQSEEAKSLDGSYGGFQPKPAVEVIIVAMKPLSEKSFVDQALANGKGVTWLDDCRVPIVNQKDVEEYDFNRRGYHERYKGDNTPFEGGWKKGVVEVDAVKGRFPANLLASDNILDDGKTTKSPSNYVNRKPRNGSVFTLNSCGFDDTQNHMSGYGDVGSFNRYFDLDAWFTEAVKKLPKEVKDTYPFLVVPKASKSERNKGCESLPEDKARAVMFTTANNTSGVVSKGFERFETLPKRNFHPTVKPLKLMSYLVTLGSRPNDLVLDPFCGSGTTCLASKMLGRNYIGIEKEAEYVVLAENRVRSHKDRCISRFLSVETNEKHGGSIS